MYILTQDKRTLMKFERIEIGSSRSGAPTMKCVLNAWSRTSDTPTILGAYASEDRAMAELQRIIMALHNNVDVYEIRGN